MQLNPVALALLGVAFTAVNGQITFNLTSVLAGTPELSTLTGILVEYPNVLSTILEWPTNLTIIAPSNAAFEELTMMNTTSHDSVPLTGGNNTDTMAALLSYHVLSGTFYSTAFIEGETATAKTLLMGNDFANLGEDAQVVLGRKRNGGVYLFSGLGMVATPDSVDIEFNGGVLHIIDSVLTLPSLVSQAAAQFNLTAVAGALVRTGLLETVDNSPSITVFAPSNAAFQAIGNLVDDLNNEQLSDILKYHVVTLPVYNTTENVTRLPTLEGGMLTIHGDENDWFVNGARIIGGKDGGVVVANGMVYVIDSVLNPSHGNVTTTYTPNPTLPTQPPAYSSASYVSDVPFTSELVSGTPSSTSTPTPTPTGADGGSAVKPMVSSSAIVAVSLFVAALGGFLML